MTAIPFSCYRVNGLIECALGVQAVVRHEKDLAFAGFFFVDSARETVVNWQRNTVYPTVQPHN